MPGAGDLRCAPPEAAGPDAPLPTRLEAAGDHRLSVAFGIGLVVSGMADPAKAPDFPDLAGIWDPSLAWRRRGLVLSGSFDLLARPHKGATT